MVIVDKDNISTPIDYPGGAVILIDKSSGWTSFDVVNKIRFSLRKALEIKKIKVGHNGTLDPLADGLVMIFTGKYTKLIPQYMDQRKIYSGRIKLGCTTATLDREAEESQFCDTSTITHSEVHEAITGFTGRYFQKTPVFSALKVNGKRSYELARKGIDVEPKVREVTVHSVSDISFENPIANFKLVCSKGFYVRSFARDVGHKLGVPAYLYALRREGIGDYSVHNALKIEEFIQQFTVAR